MSVQPALVVETIEATEVLEGAPARQAPRRGRFHMERVNWPGTIIIALCAITVLVPLYVTISMAFKTHGAGGGRQRVLAAGTVQPRRVRQAWNLTNFPLGVRDPVLVTAATGRRHDPARLRSRPSRSPATGIAGCSAGRSSTCWWRCSSRSRCSRCRRSSSPGSSDSTTRAGVTLLHIMFQLSFSVLLFTAFLRSIPLELEESARIDGATTWQTFWQLIFPLLAPMSATVGIFAFLASWNDFMMPSLIISDPGAADPAGACRAIFQTQFSNNYNVSFASYLMAMAPAIIVYLFTQRWVMEGVTQGAVKG